MLALLGCRSIAELSRDYLVLPATREQTAHSRQSGLKLIDSLDATVET